MASLLLEALLAVLLVATIGYAAMLDRRLRTLRQSRDEMQALIASFTAATAHAQAGLISLRETSQSAGESLQSDIERAKSLRDDLSFLLDRGNSLADRLEGGIGAARVAVKSQPRVKPEPIRAEEEPEEPKPVVRLAETPKRQAAAQAPRGGIPGAKVISKREAAAAAVGESDDEMARQLLRALKTAR
ncbi:MAG: DUF6468 domain-containing protein [Alphaproteobacteria bacterium]